MLLDGLGLRLPGPAGGVHALEFVALAGLAVALARHGRDLDAASWSTPVDGRIVALLAVLLLAALPGRPASPGAIELRLVFAGAALFYSIARLADDRPAGAESVWVVFPVAAGALGLHALWAATAGLDRLQAAARATDAAWQGHGALASATVFATPTQLRIMYRELKRQGQYPTPEQREWLAVLEAAGADVGVWRPADLLSGRIVSELRGTLAA